MTEHLWTANGSVAREHLAQAHHAFPTLAQFADVLDRLDWLSTPECRSISAEDHLRGLSATAELSARAGVSADMHVLDAGCGLGGPSRYLVGVRGCSVIGLDPAPSNVEAAWSLTGQTRGPGRVTFQVGSVMALPFANHHFDLVWMQQAAARISERVRLYSEVRRVLKPGGLFAFYEPYLPDKGSRPVYPMPWAETDAEGTLLTDVHTIDALEEARLRVLDWHDATGLLAGWLERDLPRMLKAFPPSTQVGEPSSLQPPDQKRRLGPAAANFVRNIGGGRLRMSMCICMSTDPAPD